MRFLSFAGNYCWAMWLGASVVLPLLAVVVFRLERGALPLVITHGLPFAVFGVVVCRRGQSMASLCAFILGVLAVLSVYFWGWYASRYYGGGGANFAWGFAYVLLGGIATLVMATTFSFVSQRVDRK